MAVSITFKGGPLDGQHLVVPKDCGTHIVFTLERGRPIKEHRYEIPTGKYLGYRSDPERL